jgi:hypothetical protein
MSPAENGVIKDSCAIRQDRCITFYSGYSGPQDFPVRLNPAWIELPDRMP